MPTSLDDVISACDSFERKDSKFSEFVGKLEKEGKSKSYATKIAAKVGREKLGAHEMAKRAAASRAKHAR